MRVLSPGRARTASSESSELVASVLNPRPRAQRCRTPPRARATRNLSGRERAGRWRASSRSIGKAPAHASNARGRWEAGRTQNSPFAPGLDSELAVRARPGLRTRITCSQERPSALFEKMHREDAWPWRRDPRSSRPCSCVAQARRVTAASSHRAFARCRAAAPHCPIATAPPYCPVAVTPLPVAALSIFVQPTANHEEPQFILLILKI